MGFPLYEKLRLCIEEEKYSKLLFFDAFDTIKMLKGIEGYFSDGKDDTQDFDKIYFESKRCFILNLAIAECFSSTKSKISLLPTHLAEFYHNVESLFGRATEFGSDDRIQKIEQIFQEHKIAFKTDSFSKLQSEEQKREFLNKFIKESRTIFKLLSPYNLSNKNERIKYLFKHPKIIHIYPISDPAKISNAINTETFDLLLEEINNIRPSNSGETRNRRRNINDAIALAFLANLVSEFNKNPSLELPILYETQGGFFDRVIKGSGMKDLFMVKIGYSSNYVVRDSQYFLLKSCYRDNIEQWKELLKEATKIDLIEEEIAKYIEIDFIQKKLLKNKTLSQIGEISKKITPILDVVRDKNINREIEKIKKEIIRAINNLKLLFIEANKIGRALDSLLQVLGKEIKTWNIIDDFGVFRFSFGENINAVIEDIVSRMIENRGQQGMRQAEIVSFADVLMNKHNHYKQKGISSNIDLLKIKIGVLWILQQYDQIIKLLKNEKGMKDCSIYFAEGASYLNCSSKYSIEKIADILLELQKLNYNNVYSSVERQIARAYLSFHVFETEKGIFTKTNGEKFDPEYSYAMDSIKYAEAAYNIVRKKNEQKKDFDSVKKEVYCENLKYYYIIEAGDKKQFELIDISSFLDKSRDAGIWQYRYYDTIARYYHRKSIYDVSKKDKKLDYQRAKENIEKAYRLSNGDPRISSYLARLDKYGDEFKRKR